MIGPAEKILIIGDDRSFRKTIAGLLRTNGYRVVDQNSSFHVVRSITREQPDLLLLDLCLPGEIGMGIIQTLRRNGMQVRIVVISGNMDKVDVRTPNELGIVDFIAKPIGVDSLLMRVRKALSVKRAAGT